MRQLLECSLRQNGFSIKRIPHDEEKLLCHLSKITFMQTYGKHIVKKSTFDKLNTEMETLYSAEQLKAWLEKPQYICLGLYKNIHALAAEPNKKLLKSVEPDELCGFSVLEIKKSTPEQIENGAQPEYAVLDKLYLLKEVQGKRLGKFLIDAYKSELRKHHITHIELDVWDQNTQAKRFYERLGFHSTGIKKPYPYSSNQSPDYDEVYCKDTFPEVEIYTPK